MCARGTQATIDGATANKSCESTGALIKQHGTKLRACNGVDYGGH